ncbi:MAG: hypothetical protein ACPH79_04130, partial [Paracoccaceae bacterium]
QPAKMNASQAAALPFGAPAQSPVSILARSGAQALTKAPRFYALKPQTGFVQTIQAKYQNAAA